MGRNVVVRRFTRRDCIDTRRAWLVNSMNYDQKSVQVHVPFLGYLPQSNKHSTKVAAVMHVDADSSNMPGIILRLSRSLHLGRGSWVSDGWLLSLMRELRESMWRVAREVRLWRTLEISASAVGN